MAELMKGHKWRDHAKKMTYPAWVEIKSDEIRCHVIVTPQGPWDVQFLSFAGKPLANMEQFKQGFIDLAKDTGIYEFDTGFMVGAEFNATYRWTRSTKNGIPPELKDAPTLFLLFDLPTLDDCTFEKRMQIRHSVVAHGLGLGLQIVQPFGRWAHTPEEVERLFVSARDEGHEGLMVKAMDHLYERGKRTYGWLKVKPEDDADGRIVEILRAVSIEGQPLNRAGSVRIEVEDGSEACPHGIPHELGEAMWRNPEKFLGQWAEFKFMERDRQGGYRHPTWGRLREAKA